MSTAQIPTLIGCILLAVLLVLAGWLAIDKDALHDPGNASRRPFSFARVQLLWWTVLILGAWTSIYSLRHELWPLTSDCLALMGISLGTTASARLVEDRDRASGMATLLDTQSEGFLRDILSDGRGLSVHRLQSFIFNLAFGSIFLVKTFTLGIHGFPSFDATTLALLGVSSGGYVFMKTTEAAAMVDASTMKGTNGSPTMASQTQAMPIRISDELVDPDEYAAAEH